MMSSSSLEEVSEEKRDLSVDDVDGDVDGDVNDDVNPDDVRNDGRESVDDIDDRLMSPEEERELDSRMEIQKLSLLNSLKQYEQWSDRITKRRMFALSRVRKLKQSRSSRLKFYDDVKDIVRDAHQDRNSETNVS